MARPKKFKVIEKDAKGAPGIDDKKKDILWEGEQVQAQSTTKLEQDTGTGREVVLRFFDFGANPQTFKDHKPTAQELFNLHLNGLRALMWKDGLKPFEEVEPRLLFSKDKSHYRFIIACVPMSGRVLSDTPRTLTQLLK